jgi:hypothetical protein
MLHVKVLFRAIFWKFLLKNIIPVTKQDAAILPIKDRNVPPLKA